MQLFWLRPVASEDESFLYQLYVSAREEEMASWGWTSEQADVFLHMQWLAQQSSYAAQFPHATHTIIVRDQESIGRCYVDYAETYLRLIDISIARASRNKGWGSAVLQALQQEALKRSVPILLSVRHGNPARRLYERLGFICADANEMYASMRWQPPNKPVRGEG